MAGFEIGCQSSSSLSRNSNKLTLLVTLRINCHSECTWNRGAPKEMKSSLSSIPRKRGSKPVAKMLDSCCRGNDRPRAMFDAAQGRICPRRRHDPATNKGCYSISGTNHLPLQLGLSSISTTDPPGVYLQPSQKSKMERVQSYGRNPCSRRSYEQTYVLHGKCFMAVQPASEQAD